MIVMNPPRNTGTPLVAQMTDPAAVPPIPRRNANERAGHYQSVLLNTRLGTLTFHCADWRETVTQDSPRAAWDAHYPGTLVSWKDPKQWADPVPELLRWVIDSGDKEIIPDRPYLTVKQGNEFVLFLLPLAQTLVDQLFRVRGTDDLDWSAESATAMRNIQRACHRTIQSPVDRYPELVNFQDAVQAVPRLVTERPRWPEMDDAQLDRQCEGLTRLAMSETWHRTELLAAFGKPNLELLGIRAWAYAYRASMAQVGGQA